MVAIAADFIVFQEREKHDQTILELRKELQDANLALSEARSLISANQRQEISQREKYNAEIRDLQLRLHRAEVGIFKN